MTEREVYLFVPGVPAPQGSKRYLGTKGGKGILVESSKAVKPWRADVREAALSSPVRFAKGVPLTVALTFVMPRPKTMPKGRMHPVVTPDLDKLVRAVLDALKSAGIYHDDAQVVEFDRARKRYLDPFGDQRGTGVHIWAWEYGSRNPFE